MNDLIVWRDKLQELYAMKSIYIDKAVQFVLALVTFLMINQNIGLMKAVATPVVAVALAVICTFLPLCLFIKKRPWDLKYSSHADTDRTAVQGIAASWR